MALYFIGDLQSCCAPFKSLLRKIDFNPSSDELILLGDMINRGPQTLETLDTIIQYDGAIQCLLGNHDIHFLGVAYNLRRELRLDTLSPILSSPKRQSYVDWMRQQRMAIHTNDWLAVHAGVAPEWTLEETLSYAHEVEEILRSSQVKDFLQNLFSDTPDTWSHTLTGTDRLRFIVNALTRIRFCHMDGKLDMACKKGMSFAPSHLTPWFNMPSRKTKNTPIAFGHWSTLESVFPAKNVMALDTGCLWGEKLTAAKIENRQPPTIIQVSCKGLGIEPFSS